MLLRECFANSFRVTGIAGQYIQLAGRPSVNRKRRVNWASQALGDGMKPAFSSRFGCWPPTPVPYGPTGSKLDISNPNRYGTILLQLAVLLCGRIYAS